ncbi:thiol-disulfide oxidoreductase DCC family protein [Caulobacter zeae]|uniref:Thiol-disulfide oxidoreductase DCC family protein n=1 Tax=Caulobacter zeae TaxID=2055137 RepID=A0A2N5DR50_9CAUL|nr:DCC1-like thiol-disulfide oxidoreductase family protein [Caulobacter zeae]PLR28531.1 thiol-disulfide oxidoreductase DCC family protein [Caulobacter zeae]
MSAPVTAPEPLWLFDGVCNLCSGSVRAVLAIDRKGIMRFTPIQSDYGRALAIAHGIDPDHPASFLYLDDGKALEKSAAILALLRRLGAPWSGLAAVVGLLPKTWLDGGYDWLAANRYRLMGKRSTCMVPTPAQRTRFVLEPPTA